MAQLVGHCGVFGLTIWVETHGRIIFHIAIINPALRLFKMLVPRWVRAQEPAIPGGIEARLHVYEPVGLLWGIE